MLQRTNAAGIAIIKGHEKCVLRAYRDTGRVWTIGWGHTGPDVAEGDWWSQEQADTALLKDLANAERAVNSFVHRTLNENQFSALVSFTYNEGSGTFFESSVLMYLNHNDFARACENMALYNKLRRFPGGPLVVSDELIRRRAEEMALFRKPVETYGPPVPPGWPAKSP